MILNSLYSSIAFKREAHFEEEYFKVIKYQYGNPSYDEFSRRYSGEGFLKRKVIALPKFFRIIFVKTLMHILITLNKSLKKKRNTAKLNFYKVIRDIEEASGWLITIFHDKIGSYLVQESKFQKKCYSHHRHLLKKEEISKIRFNDLLENIKKNCWNKEALDRSFIYSKKGKENYLSLKNDHLHNILIENQSSYYFDSLSMEQCRVLNYSLFTKEIILKIFKNNELGKKRFEILSEDLKLLIIKKFQVDDLWSMPKEIQLKYLNAMKPEDYKNLDFKKLNLNILVLLFNLNSNERKSSVKYLTPFQIQDIILRIKENQFWFFKLITKKQLKRLDLDLIGSLKFYWLAGNQEVFSSFSSIQLQKILHQLDKGYLRKLSSMQLKNLDITQLSSGKIETIFTRNSFAWNDLNEISFKQLQKILPFLNENLLQKINIKRLKKIDFTEMDQDLKNTILRILENKEEELLTME